MRAQDRPETTNFDRAERIYRVGLIYGQRTGESDGETILTDMLADMMHEADQQGYDWQEIARRARGYYEEEVGA